MVLDGDGNRWNAHVDPASGNTYYVNERTGVSSWTLPKKGTSANGAASGGASPLKIALGVVIIAVLACFLPADSALRGAVPFSFPMLYGAASFFITPSRREGDPPAQEPGRAAVAAPRRRRRRAARFACGVLLLCARPRAAFSRHSVRGEGTRRTPSTPTRATAGAPSAERLLEAVSTRHLPDAATAAGGSASKTKLAGAAVVGLVCFPRPLFQSS